MRLCLHTFWIGPLDLRVKYSLPLNDENVRLLSKGVWKSMVKNKLKPMHFLK